MNSLKTKISAVTISAIVITMIIATLFGVLTIRHLGADYSERMLRLLSESGGKNLDSILTNVEQDVETISAYVEADLDGLDDQRLQSHLDRVSEFFPKILYKTNGVLTYYYRIDPEISKDVKGFWFVNTDGSGYKRHEVTDITKYDTHDLSQLVWFTVPKVTGESVWIHPYITDNLDERVLSYNTPVYLDGRFVGVIGIEIDYTFMADMVNNIILFDHGYAFISDADGNLIYHPNMDVLTMDNLPDIPSGLESQDTLVKYNYEGVDKLAAGVKLCNGDSLYVSVPVQEINETWQGWIRMVVVVFSILIIVFIAFIMRFAEEITRPLRNLTKLAERIDEGDYDNVLEYDGNDEIGLLTHTLNRVTQNLKSYITDLNDLAYADALTSLHNKGAFDACIKKLQNQINDADTEVAFAVCIFDCNNLKKINDSYGHDKGDIYLKGTAEIICKVFEHSPVYRIGGDEFAAILMDYDYKYREALLRLFDERCYAKREGATNMWEQVDVARGMAVYEPKEDELAYDVVRRADKKMYENKWRRKNMHMKDAAV